MLGYRFVLLHPASNSSLSGQSSETVESQLVSLTTHHWEDRISSAQRKKRRFTYNGDYCAGCCSRWSHCLWLNTFWGTGSILNKSPSSVLLPPPAESSGIMAPAEVVGQMTLSQQLLPIIFVRFFEPKSSCKPVAAQSQLNCQPCRIERTLPKGIIQSSASAREFITC